MAMSLADQRYVDGESEEEGREWTGMLMIAGWWKDIANRPRFCNKN